MQEGQEDAGLGGSSSSLQEQRRRQDSELSVAREREEFLNTEKLYHVIPTKPVFCMRVVLVSLLSCRGVSVGSVPHRH